jgi:hypothetical protein
VTTVWRRKKQGSIQTLSTTIKNLQICKRALTEWSSKKFGDVPRRLKMLKGRVEKLQRDEHPENVDGTNCNRRWIISLRWRILNRNNVLNGDSFNRET